MDCHSLLLGIFSTKGLNLDLLHCRQILHHLSHQGSLCSAKDAPNLSMVLGNVNFPLSIILPNLLFLLKWPST